MIWKESKYTPYSTHNAHPIQYIVYVIHDSPDTLRVRIDFIAWGKKVIVVHNPHAYPSISPINVFIHNPFFVWELYHEIQFIVQQTNISTVLVRASVRGVFCNQIAGRKNQKSGRIQ
jgi:hypothetical protein